MSEQEYTGGKVNYYEVEVTHPTREGREPYIAECNDIIEALGLSFSEGEAFKAIWRKGAARIKPGKRGHDGGLYDAEKARFYGARMEIIERFKIGRPAAPERHPMTPNVISYPAVEVGVDVDFDGRRVDRVANSHGDGEHYAGLAELAIQQGGKPLDPPSFDWDKSPPWANLLVRHIETGALWWCGQYEVGGQIQNIETRSVASLSHWGVSEQDSQPARFEIVAERPA